MCGDSETSSEKSLIVSSLIRRKENDQSGRGALSTRAHDGALVEHSRQLSPSPRGFKP
ncbi:hypothetical protein M378DRAFT_162820 [Amanita muscaria Koide BX008]|uniref:Uncharacterized protein n=1 Tax=Amanita muscaria (strain Koide BX008) TaxID=946122 RepID=A0A0C2WSL9_AMAMK|nr:hypothetical protein M378DRAFT_162820 [Amanita muscaria Koide BX008]